ncbi:hypothetical protein [Kitasatospora indigofera]|uniref:hypothetical protein n=1 Tax=Kitasatospora indigofera TaxID=67307 RepID=UPI003675F8A4
MDRVYVITATSPDGTAYQDELSKLTGQPASAAVYGDEDRDRRIAVIEAAGLIPHVRNA